MPSVQATVGNQNNVNPVINANLGTRVVIADGQYISKINFNITANNSMGVGWTHSHASRNDVSVGGAYTGTRTIYDYTWTPYPYGGGQTLNSSNYEPSLHSYGNGSDQFDNTYSGYGTYKNTTQANPANAPRNRNPMNTGDMFWKLAHGAENANAVEVPIMPHGTLPLPTFRLATSESTLVEHPLNTDISYQKWEWSTSSYNPYAYFPLYINPAPKIADTVLHIESNTTPHQYYTPVGGDLWLNLQQPSVYSKTTLFPYDNVANELGHTTNLNYAGTTYVKVLLEQNQWGNFSSGQPLSNISLDWEATGTRAQYMSQTSGTITNWRVVTGQPNLIVGYSPPITVTASGLSGSDPTSILLKDINSYEINPQIINHYA
jgi:hypothetical protein